MLPDDLKIAPGFTVGLWKTLDLNPDAPNSDDWSTALEIFDARIRCRFFDPIDALIAFDQRQSRSTFGFAILAIDFLVIETIQGFREGVIHHDGKSKHLFTSFLMQWDAFTRCVPSEMAAEQFAKLIYGAYRCALHHSGATEGTFRVGVSGATFAFKNEHDVKINRTLLHESLKREFDSYLADLRKADKQSLRRNFKKKMDAICGL